MTNINETTYPNIFDLYRSALNYYDELDNISINGTTYESQERFNDLQSLIENLIFQMIYQLSVMRECVREMPSPEHNNPVLKHEDDQEQSFMNDLT